MQSATWKRPWNLKHDRWRHLENTLCTLLPGEHCVQACIKSTQDFRRNSVFLENAFGNSVAITATGSATCIDHICPYEHCIRILVKSVCRLKLETTMESEMWQVAPLEAHPIYTPTWWNCVQVWLKFTQDSGGNNSFLRIVDGETDGRTD